MSLLKIHYRRYQDDDKDFITSVWTNSQASISPFNKCRKGEFSRIYKDFLNSKIPLLDIHVACNEECHDQIFGFIVTSDNEATGYSCVHFLFVKNIYRENGIAKQLVRNSIGAIPTYYSCLATNLKARRFIMKNKVTYNPFLFLFDEESTIELLQSKDRPLR